MGCLVLRLAGPMQSWGTQSRFSVRDAGQEPSKSGVLGLLAASLGLPRGERFVDVQGLSVDFRELQQLKMAVRVDRAGRVQCDYQTAGGGEVPYSTRYGVAKANKHSPATVTSNRYFLADADFRVALESNQSDLLRALGKSAREPRFQIFLGRKSFVPGYPVFCSITEADAYETLTAVEPVYYRSSKERQAILSRRRLRLVVETVGIGSNIMSDMPISCGGRDFQLRSTEWKWMDLSDAMVQEDPLCTFHD